MMRRPPFAVLACATAVALLLQSGSAAALGLLEAYQAGLRNDPVYRAAYFENQASRENRILGRAALLPSLNASYAASKNNVDTETFIPALNRSTLSHPEYISRNANVTLRQPLFNMEALARFRQGIAQAEQGEALFATRTDEVGLRVVTAYIETLFALEQERLAEAQRDMFLEQRNANQRRFEKGEGTRTDMLETQAKLDLAEAQLLEAKDNVLNARTTLAGVIGQDFDTLEPVSMELRGQGEELDFDAWRKMAMINNPELQQAAKAVEVARQQVSRDRAGHLPRLDFVASLGKTESDTLTTQNQNSTVRTVGIQLNVPLYAGGAVNASTRQSVANMERARANVQVATDKTIVELRKQHSAVVSGAARIDALVKALQSADLLIKATEQSIKGGVRINLDLLNARQQMFIVQRDLAQARYGYLVAKLKLRAAAGTLELADLEQTARNFR